MFEEVHRLGVEIEKLQILVSNLVDVRFLFRGWWIGLSLAESMACQSGVSFSVLLYVRWVYITG